MKLISLIFFVNPSATVFRLHVSYAVAVHHSMQTGIFKMNNR